MLVLETFIKWLVPFMCGGVFAWGIKQRRRKNQMDEAMVLGFQALLRAEIIRQYEKWSELGHCPIYAKEALSRAYKAYHALGGNDVATDLYEKTMSLPEHP